ncbi:MAG: hypothetical protein QM813_20065 [Verrucomicrobiota bacterium]
MRIGGAKSETQSVRRSGFVVIAVVYLALTSVMSGLAQNVDDLPVLRPIRTELPPTFWEQRGFCIGLYAVEAVAFVGFMIWLFTRPLPPVVMPIATQTRTELERLRRQAHDGLVLSKISQALRRYFAEAFHLPSGELTTGEFSRALTANGEIGGRLADQTIAFLQRCDAAKFSFTSEMNPSAAVVTALDLVAQGEARREELRQIQAAAASVVTS